MLIKPRYYQQEAIDSLWEFFRTHSTGNPVVALPTGTGKSVVIAGFLESIYKKFAGQRILVSTHVKKLIEQNHQKLLAMWPNAPAGIYSAGLRRKELNKRITFCGIASIVKNIEGLGRIDLMIIDEAHLVSPDEESMYRVVIAALEKLNPNFRVIGLTATPWRQGQGHITTDGIFTHVCYDLTTMESFNRLVDEGWLSPLITLRTELLLDVTGLHKLGGDYKQGELELSVNKNDITHKALIESIKFGRNRQSWLIFATGVKHCEAIHEMLNSMGVNCTIAHSKLPSKICDENIQNWIDNKVTAIVNNGMLTTGIDNPQCDMIVGLRPTASTTLYVQMLGRGTRPYSDASIGYSKQNCLYLDFAGNIKRLGPINDPVLPRAKGKGPPGDAPIRICNNCEMYNHASARFCGGKPITHPDFNINLGCGTEFPTQTKLNKIASSLEVIKRPQEPPKTLWLDIDSINYALHRKPGKADCLRVSYFTKFAKYQEYVHFELSGALGRKARSWWDQRTVEMPFPTSTIHAAEVAHLLPIPRKALIWVNTQFPEILKISFEDIVQEV